MLKYFKSHAIPILIAIGCFLMACWMYLFAVSTFNLISQIINDEPYYFDNTFIYCFVYAIAPFVVANFLLGLTKNRNGFMQKIRHMFMRILLILFALMQLFFSLGFFIIIFSTSENHMMFEGLVLLLFPISFFIAFTLILMFLHRTTIKQ